MKSENRRLQYEQANVKEKIKDNKEKIKMNKQLPYLVGNVVEVRAYVLMIDSFYRSTMDA
jgi:26S proteasome regulatory subunit T5